MSQSPIKKNGFDFFWDNPAVYCSKLIKKNNDEEALPLLEEVIVQLRSLEIEQIGRYDKDQSELLAIMTMLYLTHRVIMKRKAHLDTYEVILDKLEEKWKYVVNNQKLAKFPFAFDYFTALLWQFKGMDRQAKEKLHLLAIQLEKDRSQEVIPKDSIGWPVLANIIYFWVWGNSLEEQIKLVYFELNRIYMRSKDYRTGYKILKKLIDTFPSDIEVLLKIAKYCHYIGRNKESKKYYSEFTILNRNQA